ncbi:translocator assembly/maintenance protein isoform X1 [Tasmannia lanceolata]|uniref:translocator assembly/maintenance protein isoform X1 n=1 Tax=Tasmannia lanceolata TaxID=3420 RepID=UPI0040636467
MEKVEVEAPLHILPSVEFCCAYGSSFLPNNQDKTTTMVDYILGVSDPLKWHSENLEKNRDHYSSWMALLGPKMITQIADGIGVGVHFNPFVMLNEKRMIKYGVVRMHRLVEDSLNWDRFYLSGRLQKPVHVLVDNLDLVTVNEVNLKAATSAALLLLPPEFTEEDLYAKICSLSYMGDLRMLFAEDRNKVKNIVKGSFGSFRAMYKPFLDEFTAKELLEFLPTDGRQAAISQDYSLSAARTLVSSLPHPVRSQMGMELGEKQKMNEYGRVIRQVIINSREEAAKSMQKIVRRTVMVSSARQAISGLLSTGGFNAARYLASKMSKAWKSQN